MASKAAAAKRKAQASVTEGEVWAVPVPGMGFSPLVVTRAPRPRAEVDFAFAYLRPALCESMPAAESIPPLESWGRAWVGLVPTLPLRNGRWRSCGMLPGFERERWPVPPSRHSAVDEIRDPVQEWDAKPWGELWSIETTPDEPSMLVIDNTAATREEALCYPRVGIVTGASQLEKALVNHHKSRSGSFWEMPLVVNDVAPDRLALWASQAAAARARWAGTPASWRPAGKKTDRELKAGTWLGFPVTGGGYGAAMLVCKPPKHFRIFADAVVMLMRRRWERWPRLEELIGLRPEDGALVTQTSMICVRDGRWRVIGEHPRFDPGEWPWPIPWWQDVEQRKAGVVSVNVSATETQQVKVAPQVLALDPLAGERSRSMSGYGALEQQVRMILDGTSWELGDASGGIVTPERLRAWRAINAEIVKATGLTLS